MKKLKAFLTAPIFTHIDGRCEMPASYYGVCWRKDFGRQVAIAIIPLNWFIGFAYNLGWFLRVAPPIAYLERKLHMRRREVQIRAQLGKQHL